MPPCLLASLVFGDLKIDPRHVYSGQRVVYDR